MGHAIYEETCPRATVCDEGDLHELQRVAGADAPRLHDLLPWGGTGTIKSQGVNVFGKVRAIPLHDALREYRGEALACIADPEVVKSRKGT